MKLLMTAPGVEFRQFFDDRRNTMQMDRRHDEIVFCHAMGSEELKTHLERSIVSEDCSLCEWFKNGILTHNP